jgi:hypothetical protein
MSSLRSSVRALVAIRRIHDSEHLIADDVAIPIADADRADTEKAIAVLGGLREKAIAAMKANKVELAGPEDKVVVSFDYRIEGGAAIVQIAQVAE